VNTPDSYQQMNCGSRSRGRMVRRLQLSEAVCRELRYILTARVVEQDWSRICTMLHKWMKYAPKDVRYSRPPNAEASDGGTNHD
jgi:hypothetical protein